MGNCFKSGHPDCMCSHLLLYTLCSPVQGDKPTAAIGCTGIFSEMYVCTYCSINGALQMVFANFILQHEESWVNFTLSIYFPFLSWKNLPIMILKMEIPQQNLNIENFTSGFTKLKVLARSCLRSLTLSTSWWVFRDSLSVPFLSW